MSDRVRLTSEQQSQILDAIWTKQEDGSNGYPVVRWGIQFSVVESIVAERVAAALEQQANDFSWRLRHESETWPDAADVLLDIADDIDPKRWVRVTTESIRVVDPNTTGGTDA